MGIQVGGQVVMSPLQTLEVKSQNPQHWTLLTHEESSSVVKQTRHLSNAAEVMYLSLVHLLSHTADNPVAQSIITGATQHYTTYLDTYSLDEWV